MAEAKPSCSIRDERTFSSSDEEDVTDYRPPVNMNNIMSVKHLICMVGLPARGKTYISMKLGRYLKWIGINCKVFHVGMYRRKATMQYRTHDFFLPDNAEAMEIRNRVAEAALKDCIKFLLGDGDVAIFDATNVTVQRRAMIHEKISHHGFMCLFIESICDKPELLSANITDVKVHGPDYEGMNKEEAVQDFIKRIEHYQDMYVPLSEEEESHLSFMKMFNAGEKIIMNRPIGNLQSRIGYWLLNIHITPRTIYLTRHGESLMNLEGKIGGDGELSPRGWMYANQLSEYINKLEISNVRVWTSWLERTIQTASGIKAPQERWKALNEIDAGICEEMTYNEIKEKFPVDYSAREQNKLTYRYPGGESYEDVIARLEPVTMELERQKNVIVVGHQAVLRCLLCYFMDTPMDKLPYVEVPLHTLIKISPVAYGCEIEKIPFSIPAVSTHRPKTNESESQ